jgi:benzoate/toluate 1,2-dioxygenase subunit beta
MNDALSALEREASRLFAREAYCLDRKLWRDWLALYTDDAEFWAPAWATEEEITGDPANELSMIYINGRGGLEDRIYRIESRDSLATVPMDRTAHVMGPVSIPPEDEGAASAATVAEFRASVSWITHIYGIHGTATLGGYSDYTLRRVAEAWRIAKKRVVLIDDRLEVPVDIYHL